MFSVCMERNDGVENRGASDAGLIYLADPQAKIAKEPNVYHVTCFLLMILEQMSLGTMPST